MLYTVAGQAFTISLCLKLTVIMVLALSKPESQLGGNRNGTYGSYKVIQLQAETKKHAVCHTRDGTREFDSEGDLTLTHTISVVPGQYLKIDSSKTRLRLSPIQGRLCTAGV